MRPLALLILMALASCTATQRDQPPPSRVVALVNGQPLTLDQLAPALMDAVGAVVLRERVLGQMLTARCQVAAIIVTPEMIQAERAALVLPAASDAEPDQLREIGKQLARDRGLSDARLTELLRQNAMLRALTAPAVSVPDSAIAALYQVRHGPRMQASVIVVRSASLAGRLIEQLRAADPGSAEALFAAAARSNSIDASAAAGGVLPPISAADPGVPLALRNALASLTPGHLAGPILLADGYAIARLSGPVVASPITLQEARGQLASELRTRLEREAMDRLANELLGQAQIVLVDPALVR